MASKWEGEREGTRVRCTPPPTKNPKNYLQFDKKGVFGNFRNEIYEIFFTLINYEEDRIKLKPTLAILLPGRK